MDQLTTRVSDSSGARPPIKRKTLSVILSVEDHETLDRVTKTRGFRTKSEGLGFIIQSWAAQNERAGG